MKCLLLQKIIMLKATYVAFCLTPYIVWNQSFPWTLRNFTIKIWFMSDTRETDQTFFIYLFNFDLIGN